MRNRNLAGSVRRWGITIAGVVCLLVVSVSLRGVTGTGASYVPDCNDPDSLDINCLEPTKAIILDAQQSGYEYYIGHAEPTTEFFSTSGTSGNNMQWKVQLPATEPAPAQDGSAVANFELYSTFWMGLALCDPNSNPFGSCVADSDANNPSTAGAGFLELQFYPPGLTCGSDTQWCVRLHINTLQNANTFQKNNCLEPTTQAFVTTDGTPGGSKLLMSNGDSILVTIHDTASGLETEVNDLTTATTGTMVASGANGFVHNANQTDCATTAFDFHPMYATASPGQVVPWASLAPNVSLDFEIAHWELCGDAACMTLPDGGDADDTNCSTVRGVGGCFGSDTDHDGTSYQADWPDGSASFPSTLIIGSADDKGVGPLSTSVSQTSNYDEGYPTIKFATTESIAAPFYPFFSQAGTGASCVFNFGNFISGVTTNDFGQAAQYGTTIDNPCLPGTPPDAKCTDVTVPTDPNVCTASSASIDDGSSDADGDPVTLSQAPPSPYPLGTTAVTLTVTEPETTSATCSANVTVLDQQLPDISCPTPVVECTSPAGAPVTLDPTVSDNCPGIGAPVCTPPSGSTFPLGSTPFSCMVSDGSSNSNSCNSTVTVQDTMAPVISSVTATPNALWPPNHTMVPVTVSVSVTDICDPNPVCTLTAIASNEPAMGGGSGHTSPDFLITGPLSADLRAERDGTGSGRIYTLTVQCSDHSGNSSQGMTSVVVAHDMSH
jgi:HYR domain